jgi:serine/threonine-protein kinase
MSSDPSTKGPQRTVRIGKYRVVAHLATGGMGAVYKAYDSETKRDVALKVLTPEMASKPIMVERFKREAKHARKLRHRNIVEVYDCDEADGCFYIAMEFVEGIDLNEYVERKGPLDPEEALRFITQATKALDHAYRKGIVHRDVKPSNFLVTRLEGRLIVKLTDLGLSREARDEEFRVTRAGTTVGTVDYISPEQARDSGTADVRSDLYSLGCTWHHLLAGKPPFAEGGLAERLHKHLHVDPPDVREANPRVSRAMSAVLRRLLAKRPADRYQTPSELLKDLAALVGGRSPVGGRAVLLGLMEDDDGPTPPARPTAALASAKTRADRRARRSGTSKARRTDPARRKARERNLGPYILGGSAAALIVAAVVVAAVLWPRPRPHVNIPDPRAPETIVVSPPDVVKPSAPDSGDVKPPDHAPDKPPNKPRWPVLDPTAAPVDAADLRRSIETPWVGHFQRTADALVLHVARTPHPTLPPQVGEGWVGGPDKTYPTLAAAVAAAPVGRLSVVEIDDDGPLFETSASFADRSLILCAGAGFRPLVVWDEQRSSNDAARSAFLSVEHGGLRLENLDVVFAPHDTTTGGLALLDARDAELWAEGCTFSLAGKPREGTVVARVHGTNPNGVLCRFNRCFVRGPAVTAVDMDAPGASVLIDRSLVVGGDAPLLRVRASDAQTTYLSVVRSTLVCGRTALTVGPAADANHKPAVAWLGWDCLLSRSSDQGGGDMIQTAAAVDPSGIQWRPYNCLYAGWKDLLTGKETITAIDAAGWNRFLGNVGSDAAERDAWPSYSEDPSALPASMYSTADTALAFAATAAPDGPLGCDLNDLPPTRDGWQALTKDFIAPQFYPITDAAAPTVKPGADNLYHGGPIDLDRPDFDLGAFLRDYEEKHLLAPRVVLLLSGAGEHPITPFHLRGCTLVLYAEPPREDAAPLTLTWAGQGSVGQDGFIEIEDGGLDLIHVNLKLADFPRAEAPEYMVKVRGDLRLYRSRLEGLQQNLSDPYQALIDVEGSSDPSPAAACACAITDSVLVSGRDGVRLSGVGARLLLRQSVLVAGGDGLHLDPGPRWAGRANAQCVLDHTTIAVRRSVVHLDDVSSPSPTPPSDSAVVRSQDCAFLAPFAEKSIPSGMIAFEKTALAHGLLVWRGDGDVFDKRLTFAAAPLSSPPDKEELLPTWTRLWGSNGEGRPAAEATLNKTFTTVPWPLDRLALPKLRDDDSADKRPPGADLGQLGLLKKPTKPH